MLYNRGYSYYVVENVPTKLIPIVGKKQIWVSLHTKQKDVAIIKSAVVLSDIKRFFMMGKQKMAVFNDETDDAPRLKVYYELLNTPQGNADYTDDDIEMYALDFCINKALNEFPQLECDMQTLNYFQYLLNENITAYKFSDFSAVKDAVDAYIETHKLKKPTESCYPKFLKAFMLGYLQYLQLAVKRTKNIELKRPRKLITEPPQTEQVIQQMQPLNIASTKSNITLVELAEKFNNAMSRANVAKEHKEKILQRLTIWDNLLQHKTIGTITTEDIQKLVPDLKYLPYRLSKNDIKGSLLTVIEKNRNNPTHKGFSFDTQVDYIKVLKSALKWAVTHKYVAENAVDAVDVPAPPKDKPQSKYLSYTPEELNKIINSDLFQTKWGNHTKNGILRWLILLGMFTGARLNELCQLRISDIREENGIHYISINTEDGKTVKTAAGCRKIPIHNELIKLGFLQYVDTIRKEKDKHLFQGLTANKRMSEQPTKWYARFLDRIGITQKGKVFHSYRHTVREITRNNNIRKDIIERICGWEDGDKGLSNHYGDISLELLYTEFNDKLRYDGLDLSHLYVDQEKRA
jgi:integrase